MLITNDIQLQEYGRELLAVAEASQTRPILSFDFETTSNDLLIAKPVGLSLSYDGENAVYISISHVGENVSESELRNMFNQIIIPNYIMVAHNIQFDYSMMRKLGTDIPRHTRDTYQMANTLQLKHLALKTLALAFNLLDWKEIQTLDKVLAEYWDWTKPESFKEDQTIFNDPEYPLKYNCGMVDVQSQKASNYLKYCLNDARLTVRLYQEIMKMRREKASIVSAQELPSIFDI